MIAPIYGYLNVAAVNAFVSGRIYGFGQAPQSPAKPYITWQVVSGVPSNYHDRAPTVDRQRIQVDIWSDDQSETLSLGTAVRTEMDKHGHQLNQLGPEVDDETYTNRLMLDYAVWVTRSSSPAGTPSAFTDEYTSEFA